MILESLEIAWDRKTTNLNQQPKDWLNWYWTYCPSQKTYLCTCVQILYMYISYIYICKYIPSNIRYQQNPSPVKPLMNQNFIPSFAKTQPNANSELDSAHGDLERSLGATRNHSWRLANDNNTVRSPFFLKQLIHKEDLELTSPGSSKTHRVILAILVLQIAPWRRSNHSPLISLVRTSCNFFDEQSKTESFIDGSQHLLLNTQSIGT